MTTSVMFGAIIGADDVTAAVKGHLQTWMPTYVAEVARQAGIDADAMPAIADYEIRTDQVLDKAARLPALKITCDELGAVMRRGGELDGTFRVIVRAYAGAHTEEASTQLVRRYAKAARAALLQHPDLGGFAAGVRLIAEAYAAPRVADEQWANAAAVMVDVSVPSIVDTDRGPTVPPEDPHADPGDLPETTEIIVTVDPDGEPPPDPD